MTTTCYNCSKSMTEGYLAHGQACCSDACLYADGYTRAEYADDHESGDACWTTFDDDSSSTVSDAPGVAIFPELRKRFSTDYMGSHTIKAPVRGGEDIYHLLAPTLGNQSQEVFWALYVDVKGNPIHSMEISRGTLSSSLVHPREVFAPALVCGAAAIIVAHNHPSGEPEPSADDRTTTRRLQRAGRLLGIELLDHVVIGHGGKFYSFLEQGGL